MATRAAFRAVFIEPLPSTDRQFGLWAVQAYDEYGPGRREYHDDELTAWVAAFCLSDQLGWLPGTFYIGFDQQR